MIGPWTRIWPCAKDAADVHFQLEESSLDFAAKSGEVPDFGQEQGGKSLENHGQPSWKIFGNISATSLP